jgi:periplasmic protein TonB
LASAPRSSEDAAAPATTAPNRSLLGSIEKLERGMATGGRGGEGTLDRATGQQMGALFFDPQGADFTAWINHLRNEVFRNWIVPQAVMLGYSGQVDIEFTVARNGTLHGLKVLTSTGTVSLDRAAANALLGSRLLSLPSDYAPPDVTIRATFIYNAGRSRS